MGTVIAVKRFKWTMFILRSVDEGSKKSNPSTFLLKSYPTETYLILQGLTESSLSIAIDNSETI